MEGLVITPERVRQLRSASEISYPFSPKSTSSPKIGKFNRTSLTGSPNDSTSSDSSANLTGHASFGVEESLIIEKKPPAKLDFDVSGEADQTAIEYIPKDKLQRKRTLAAPSAIARKLENIKQLDTDVLSSIFELLNIPVPWSQGVLEMVAEDVNREKKYIDCAKLKKVLVKMYLKCSDEAEMFIYIVTRGKSITVADYDDLLEFCQLCSLRFYGEEEKVYQFLGRVALERLLWESELTNQGRIRCGDLRASKNLLEMTRYLFDDRYIERSCAFVMGELTGMRYKLEEEYFRKHFRTKGIPDVMLTRVIDRHFLCFSDDFVILRSLIHFVFAFYGPDDIQSIKYWHDLLNVQGTDCLNFDDLEMFYDGIEDVLKVYKVSPLPFEDVISQYCDMLNTDRWTLRAWKRNRGMASRIIYGFTNAFKYFEQETDERANIYRVDDEWFGCRRSIWERTLDHKYDNYYKPSEETQEGIEADEQLDALRPHIVLD